MTNHDITALIKQEFNSILMGGESEDVFFSLEDDEPQANGEKIVPPPSEEVLESVVVLDS